MFEVEDLPNQRFLYSKLEFKTIKFEYSNIVFILHDLKTKSKV